MRFDTVLQRDVAHPSHGLVAVDLTADFGREGYKIYLLLLRLQSHENVFVLGMQRVGVYEQFRASDEGSSDVNIRVGTDLGNCEDSNGVV